MAGKPRKQDRSPAEKQEEPDRAEVEVELDEGLDETFPASDPVAIVDPSLPRSPRHRREQTSDEKDDESRKSGREQTQ